MFKPNCWCVLDHEDSHYYYITIVVVDGKTLLVSVSYYSRLTWSVEPI